MTVTRLTSRMDANGKRFVIVASRWNELVVGRLIEGALDEFDRYGAESVEVIFVPGTWEIPPVVKKLLQTDSAPAGVVALGCILQGQTTHARLLGADVSSALMAIQVDAGVPVGWGILTPDTLEQALDRAGAKHGNKGREAAQAVIETASVMGQI